MAITTRAQFLESFEYVIDPEYDFKIDGKNAEWASGHPREWGGETDSIKLPHNASQDIGNAHAHADMSSDRKLHAVSWFDHVLIYDIESKELRQTLEGTGPVFFRPTRPQPAGRDGDDAPGSDVPRSYTLSTYVPDDETLRRRPNDLILWDLDRHGRLLDEEERLDIAAIASQAIQSIGPQLEKQHEWSPDFVAATSLQADFEEALRKAERQHRTKHNTVLKDSHASKSPFSPDGTRLLYLIKNKTTQHGLREPDELPHAVVWDLEAGKEVYRLQGHTDHISSATFSPNGKHIATVSWDGTMRLYEAESGVFCWATENSGGQSWFAEFSPDSTAIAWSCANGMVVKIHDVSSGKMVTWFPKDVKRRIRTLKWHPDGKSIALTAQAVAFVWRPFDRSDEGTIAQEVRLKVEERWVHAFAAFNRVSWLEDGRKLALSSSDGSIVVWDNETNAKEHFMRPKGKAIAYTDANIYYVPDERGHYYITLDGDEHIRFWRTSVPASPSWWEKEVKPQAAEKEKAPYPATGKYVKITKGQGAESEKKAERQRNIWASSGAELWTAE